MRGPPAERSASELLAFGVVNLDKPPGPSAHEVAGWVRDACDDALASGELVADAAAQAADDSAGDQAADDSAGDQAADDSAGDQAPDDAAGEQAADAPRELGGAAHGGTLDPKVTGCLPTLLGDATRIARVLHRGTKEYVAVLELHAAPPTDLEAVVAEFEGPLYQKPPRKSAVKRDLRVREVYDLDVLEVDGRQVLLRVECEAGTYVRKLCHDLGLALGTGGHMGDLRRTATTPFDDADLVTLEALVDALAFAREGEDDPPIALRDVVEPAERALEHLPGVTIARSAAREVAEGAPVYAPGVLAAADELRSSVDGADDPTTTADDSTPTTEDSTESVDNSAGSADAAATALDRATASVDDGDAPLVACYTPDGAAVCLGRLVGDPDADEGTVVSLERVLV